MLIRESQYSNALQKYDKKLVDAIMAQEPRLSERFLVKICDFVYGEKFPFNEVRDVFAKIQDGNLIIPNINIFSFKELKEMVEEMYIENQEKQGTMFKDPYYVSPDKMIEIYLITNREQVLNFPFQNSWCLKKEYDFNQHTVVSGATIFLIYNKHFSIRSRVRYVIAEVFPNTDNGEKHIEFTATNNYNIGNKWLEPFLRSLGGGVSVLKPIPKGDNLIDNDIYNNKDTINCNRNMKNKKVVRLTESQLHNIINKSVKKILKEAVLPNGQGTDWDESEDYYEPTDEERHATSVAYKLADWAEERPGLGIGDILREIFTRLPINCLNQIEKQVNNLGNIFPTEY